MEIFWNWAAHVVISGVTYTFSSEGPPNAYVACNINVNSNTDSDGYNGYTRTTLPNMETTLLGVMGFKIGAYEH